MLQALTTDMEANARREDRGAIPLMPLGRPNFPVATREELLNALRLPTVDLCAGL